MLSEEAQVRFWNKVNKLGPVHSTLRSRCWLWIGAVQGGYAGFTDKQRKLYGHRVSWEEKFGPVPDGRRVLHKCDVPLCVRPSHLFLGSMKENSEDMVRKGRSARGEKQGSSVLTEADVRWIRSVYVPRHPTYGCHALSRTLGVSPMTVSRAVRGECWGHVE